MDLPHGLPDEALIVRARVRAWFVVVLALVAGTQAVGLAAPTPTAPSAPSASIAPSEPAAERFLPGTGLRLPAAGGPGLAMRQPEGEQRTFFEFSPPREEPPLGEVFGRPIWQYLIGIRLNYGPENPGAVESALSYRDVWAIDVGQLRVSSGGGGGLLGLGDNEADRSRGSASLSLLEDTGSRVSLGASIETGRDEITTGQLAGLPPVRRTVLIRVSAKQALPGDWIAQMTFSGDLLGHGAGRELTLELGRQWPISEQTTMHFGLGVSWGDSTHMRAWFGVPEGSEAADRYGVYRPGSGPKELGAGLGLVTELDGRWIVYGSVSFAGLLSRASASPFVERPVSRGLAFGLAYRCC